MRPDDVDEKDVKLGALLREAHPAHPLPPRFQEDVWREIEFHRRGLESKRTGHWMDHWVRLFHRPAFVGASLAVLLTGGVSLGVEEGGERVREIGRLRYISSVDPLAHFSP